MPAVGRYLDMLFGGAAGGAAGELAHEALTAFLWLILFLIARRRMKEDPNPGERLLTWAFGIAALRDFNLFLFYSLDATGIYPFARVSALILPLDHMLSLASIMGISAAFIRFFLKDGALTRRFIQVSTLGAVVAYPLFMAVPALRAGAVSWYDRPTHLVSSLVLLAAMVYLFRHQGWLRNVLLAAFSFFLLHDLLIMLVPQGTDPARDTLIHSLRHALRVAAIAMFSFVYAREMRQDRARARLAMNRALEESENERRRSEAIMASMDDAVTLLDPDFTVLYQNRASRRIVGNHDGEKCYRGFEGRDAVCPDCPVQSAFGDGEAHTALLHPVIGGKRHDLEVQASVLRDASERVTAAIEVVRDVTNRLQTEQDLRVRNLAIEQSMSAISLADMEGNLTYVNPAFLSLWGYDSADRVVGRNATEFWTSSAEARSVMAEVLEKGSWAGEMTGQRPDGTIIYAQVQTSVIRDKDGRAHCLMAWFADVTLRKLTVEALRLSEESNRVLIECSPLGILVHDEGKIVLANPAAVSLLRAKSASDLLGRHVLSFVPTEHKPLVDNRYRDLHREPTMLRPTEYQIIVLDGTRVDVEMVSASLHHQGRYRVLTIMRDISERKRAESQLRTAKEELEKRYQELKKLDIIKDGLLRDVSHELKTPVAKQAMQLELLRSTLGSPPAGELERILQVMESSVRRQEQVIRNLLDLSRLESGGRRFNIRPVALDDILGKVVDDYRPLVSSLGGEIAMSLENLVVKGDEEMLYHVFSNLVSNAIKFRKPGDPPCIEIRLCREGEAAVARVTDHGIGMKPSELSRAFERFYQAAATVEGSGVGLTLCRAMMQGMVGSVTLESAGPGAGVTAVVRLPLG